MPSRMVNAWKPPPCSWDQEPCSQPHFLGGSAICCNTNTSPSPNSKIFSKPTRFGKTGKGEGVSYLLDEMGTQALAMRHLCKITFASREYCVPLHLRVSLWAKGAQTPFPVHAELPARPVWLAFGLVLVCLKWRDQRRGWLK